MSRRTIAFWILFAVTLAVYVIMVVWSLPAVTLTDGALPFDLRLGGYRFEEAKAYLAALPADKTAFYLNVQQRLDFAFPALVGATIFLAIWLVTPAAWGIWRWLLALTAISGSVFDYLENNAVAGMLRVGADGITPDMVASADRWTRLKSISTTITMTILLILLLVWAGRRFLARRAAST